MPRVCMCTEMNGDYDDKLKEPRIFSSERSFFITSTNHDDDDDEFIFLLHRRRRRFFVIIIIFICIVTCLRKFSLVSWFKIWCVPSLWLSLSVSLSLTQCPFCLVCVFDFLFSFVTSSFFLFWIFLFHFCNKWIINSI